MRLSCGEAVIDLEMLKRHTSYGASVSKGDKEPHVRIFWQARLAVALKPTAISCSKIDVATGFPFSGRLVDVAFECRC